jgi:uncharacterized protein (TIGR02246 family)
MKIRLFLVLASLAILGAAFAGQKDTVDAKTAEQIRSLVRKYDEAFNRGDAAGVAALYTDDAVLVAPEGTFSGRQAIEKRIADWDFQHAHASNRLDKVDRLIAAGSEVHSTGKWSADFREQSGGANQIQGRYSWVLVREGDAWKIRRHTYSEFAPKSIASHLPTLATPS